MRPARLLLAALLLAGCRHADGPDTYTWRGTIEPGAWVRVHNVTGPVRVARATGSEVVIVATRRGHGRRMDPVKMIAEERDGGVVACSAWGGASGCNDKARPRRSLLMRLLGGSGSSELDFTVALPAGTRLDVSTVNGRITVADAAGEVAAESVNGGVTVGATVGPVRAKTVNGSVAVHADSLAPEAEVSLSSVNGAVGARLPSTLEASFDLETTNGRVHSDFAQLPVTPRARHVRGVLGAGGRDVRLRTVNGTVTLEQLR